MKKGLQLKAFFSHHKTFERPVVSNHLEETMPPAVFTAMY